MWFQAAKTENRFSLTVFLRIPVVATLLVVFCVCSVVLIRGAFLQRLRSAISNAKRRFWRLRMGFGRKVARLAKTRERVGCSARDKPQTKVRHARPKQLQSSLGALRLGKLHYECVIWGSQIRRVLVSVLADGVAT